MNQWLRSYSWELLLSALIVVAVVWSSTLSPYFLNAINLANSAAFFVIFALMALGQFPVVVQGEIDLSLPSILAVSSVLLGTLGVAGFPLVAALPIVIGAAALLGVVNGLLVARYGLPSLAVTLGTAGAYRGIAYLLAGSSGVTGLPPEYLMMGSLWIGIVPMWVIVTVAAVAFFAILMGMTRFGRESYAIGSNVAAARMAAVPVVRRKVSAYAIAGAMAGLGGWVWLSQYQSARGDNADGAILFVITAVVLGGVSIKGGSGRALGVGLSLILLATIQTGMQLANVPGTSQTFVIGSLLIVALALPRILELVRSRLTPRRGSGSTRSALPHQQPVG